MVLTMINRVRDWVRQAWKEMRLQKQYFYREVGPMSRVYSSWEMVIFSFGITVGRTFFLKIPTSIVAHGDILLVLWLLHAPIMIMTANCFAEMAALVPAVGAHYHYCYSAICEFIAFLVGWNLILAYTVMTMSKCSSLSEFIDANLMNGWLSTNLRFTECSSHLFFLVKGYVDILCPIITITMASQAAWAVKSSKIVFNVLTSFTVFAILVMIITFASRMKFEKLEVKVEDEEDDMKLYNLFSLGHTALIGYESLGVMGEESIKPTETIPRSIMLSVNLLLATFILFTFTMAFGTSSSDLLEISAQNPMGGILQNMGLNYLVWIHYLGTLSALWCSTYGTMFIIIRIMYAMARDGLIFKLFSKVDRYTQTPAVPATLYGIVIGLCATFFNVTYELSHFSLIFAKVMTSVCLLVTRYKVEKDLIPRASTIFYEAEEEEDSRWVLLNLPRPSLKPTKVTHRISMLLIYNAVLSALATTISIIIIFSETSEVGKTKFEIIGYVSILCFVIFLFLLKMQPSNSRNYLSHHVSGVPVVPLIAIISEFLTAIIISREGWIWGLIWSAIGVLFYFSYSIYNSEESRLLYGDGSRWTPLEKHHQRLTKVGKYRPKISNMDSKFDQIAPRVDYLPSGSEDSQSGK